jgi:hypothetical protein
MLKVISRLRHLKQAFRADQLLPLNEGFATRPAVVRINEGDKILEKPVGR